jgi:hypothetical protein
VSLFGDPVNMVFDVARVRWRFRKGLYNPENRTSEPAGDGSEG